MTIFKDKSVKIYNDPDLTILATKPPTLYATQNKPQQTFWNINIPQTSPTLHQVNDSIGSPTIVDCISFFHGAKLSPTLPTGCNAIADGFLTTWPELTAYQVRKYLPKTQATIKGHIHIQRSNLRSTTKNIAISE